MYLPTAATFVIVRKMSVKSVCFLLQMFNTNTSQCNKVPLCSKATTVRFYAGLTNSAVVSVSVRLVGCRIDETVGHLRSLSVS